MSLSSKMCRCAAALCIFAGLFQGATASAQSAPTVSNLKSTIDLGWDLHPAMEGATLVGFLAHQVSGSPAPNGYTILWLQRTATNTFAMKGYNGVNMADAAKKLEIALAKPNMFIHTEFAAQVYNGAADTEPSATFTDMPNGLAITDPLQEVAGELPPEIIELAVELGSEGATTLSAASATATNACNIGTTLDRTLNSLTEQVEGVVASDGQSTPSIGVAALFGCCWPGSTTTNFDVPAGTFGFSGVGPSGMCEYRRPTTTYRNDCSVSITCVLTCTTTLVGPGSQKACCPGNNSGNCANTPQCSPITCP